MSIFITNELKPVDPNSTTPFNFPFTGVAGVYSNFALDIGADDVAGVLPGVTAVLGLEGVAFPDGLVFSPFEVVFVTLGIYILLPKPGMNFFARKNNPARINKTMSNLEKGVSLVAID